VILGRPTNLWLGFVTAFVGLVSVSAVTVFNADPTVVATLAGGFTGLLGALVALIAGGQPTVNAGDVVSVVTPKGQDNYQLTA
jgi:hypothetical protein